jgi:predicted Zn-dependent protease
MRRWTVFVLALFLLGCETAEKIAKQKLGDVVGEEKAESIVTVVEAVRKGVQDLTPREEYYIGRAVAANILNRYPVYEDEEVTRYVSKVGMAVAWASDVPETYGGYHFLVLDEKEPLAYSAPGGFVFISKGIIEMMEDEEELAGVLGHEVAHINKRHGLGAIKQSRLTEAFSVLVKEGKKYSSEEVKELANAYEGALGDVVNKLIEKGYDRSQESEADRLGVVYAHRAGYNPLGLVSFLSTSKSEYADRLEIPLMKTHPDPGRRFRALKEHLEEEGLKGVTESVRTSRFASIKKSLR